MKKATKKSKSKSKFYLLLKFSTEEDDAAVSLRKLDASTLNEAKKIFNKFPSRKDLEEVYTNSDGCYDGLELVDNYLNLHTADFDFYDVQEASILEINKEFDMPIKTLKRYQNTLDELIADVSSSIDESVSKKQELAELKRLKAKYEGAA